MEGSKMLKVVGILMIIFGAIALVFTLIAMLGAGLVAATGLVSMGMYWIALIISLLSAVFEFVGGIVGVSNWKKPEKANSCLTIGVIIIVLWLISTIFNLISGGDFQIISILTSLVIPVLYIIGCTQLKKLAK